MKDEKEKSILTWAVLAGLVAGNVTFTAGVVLGYIFGGQFSADPLPATGGGVAMSVYVYYSLAKRNGS